MFFAIDAIDSELNTFNRSLQPGAEDIAPEDARKCCVVEIVLTRMTGRIWVEGNKHTYFQHSFCG